MAQSVRKTTKAMLHRDNEDILYVMVSGMPTARFHLRHWREFYDFLEEIGSDDTFVSLKPGERKSVLCCNVLPEYFQRFK